MLDHMPERRKFHRLAVSVAAVIKGKDDVARGRVTNITPDGLAVHLDDDFLVVPDEPVTVTIYLDGSDQSHAVPGLHARMLWIDAKEVVVQFRPMSLTNHTRLMDIISLVGDGDQVSILKIASRSAKS